MNKLLCSIAFILSAFAATLQASAQASMAYLSKINEAELLIADSLYSEALGKYKQAFDLNPAPRANDYYNAAVCATLTGNNKTALQHLGNLSCKGIALEELETGQAFKALAGTKDWQRFAQKYKSNSRKCAGNLNQTYRDTLLAMVASDQYYHRIRAELSASNTDAALLAAYVDSIDYITNRNTDALLKLVARYGFPSEAKVGATKADGSVLYNILLRHAVQRGRQDILPVLRQAVEKGEFPPHVYAYHDEYHNKNKYATTVLRGTADGAQVLPFSAAAEEAANLERAALGMEPLADLRKKALFSISDKMFYINKPNSTIRFFKSREEMLQYIKESKM